MRLDTNEKRAAYRASMIPSGATIDPRSSDLGAAYTYGLAGKFYALAFRGKAGKPEFHYCYRNEAQREQRITEFFASIAAHVEYKAKYKAPSSAGHDVKLSDIFECSWGYDQTNIDYYQVTALIGHCMMEVREICTHSEETGWLQGNCVPDPGNWAMEADGSEAGQKYRDENGHYPMVPRKSRRVKITLDSKGNPSFRVASYASAYRITPVAVVEGKPIFKESHWTAYA